MKAILSKTVGGPETLVLEDVPSLSAGEGQVVISVKACGVNYPDVLIIQDMYQFKPPRPFSPGGEVSGIVKEVGADPKPGEKLLVLGAAGGVGLAAIELAKSMGLEVIAACSTQEKVDLCLSKGADKGMIYPTGDLDRAAQKELSKQIKDISDGGVDIIYDAVGGDYAEPSVRAMNWEGRYLVIGFPAGIPKIPLNLTLLKSCDIRGVFWGAAVARNPAGHKQNVSELFALHAAGKIKPHVSSTYPLAESAAAITELMERRAKGKVVVTV